MKDEQVIMLGFSLRDLLRTRSRGVTFVGICSTTLHTQPNTSLRRFVVLEVLYFFKVPQPVIASNGSYREIHCIFILQIIILILLLIFIRMKKLNKLKTIFNIIDGSVFRFEYYIILETSRRVTPLCSIVTPP